jgi:hypothetical protein
MDVVNRSGIHEAFVRSVVQHASVADHSFILFLDDKLNALRADAARKNLDEHPNWQYLRPGWEKDATGDNDHHACTVTKATIATEKLPAYVVAAITGGAMGFVLTLSHELRHVWQYFNVRVVFHAQTPLSWVMPPQLTPCELDTEKAAKSMLGQMYGDGQTRAYLTAELAACRPEHREVTERLATLDPTPDPEIEKKTVALLEQHAAEIRKLQNRAQFRHARNRGGDRAPARPQRYSATAVNGGQGGRQLSPVASDDSRQRTQPLDSQACP